MCVIVSTCMIWINKHKNIVLCQISIICMPISQGFYETLAGMLQYAERMLPRGAVHGLTSSNKGYCMNCKIRMLCAGVEVHYHV